MCTLCIGSNFYAQAQDLKDKDICIGTTVDFDKDIITGVIAINENDTKAGWYVDGEWEHEPYGFTATPTVTTVYTLRFTKKDGTLYEKSLTITVYEPPILEITPSNETICSGENVPLNAVVNNKTPLTEILWTYHGWTYHNGDSFKPTSIGEDIITATANNTPNTDPHLCPLASKDLHFTVNFNPNMAYGKARTDLHCTQDIINLNKCIDFFVYDTHAGENQPADDVTGTITSWYTHDFIPVPDPEHVLLTSLNDTTFYADLSGITVHYSNTCTTPSFEQSPPSMCVPIRITSNYFVLDGYEQLYAMYYSDPTMCYGDPVKVNIRLLDDNNELSSCATIADIMYDHTLDKEEIWNDNNTEVTLVFPPFTGLEDIIKMKVEGSLPGLEKEFELSLRKPAPPSVNSEPVCINTAATFTVSVDRCDTIRDVKCTFPNKSITASPVSKTDNLWTLRVPELPGDTPFQCEVTYFSKLDDKVIEDYSLTHTLQIWKELPELSVSFMDNDIPIPFDNAPNLCLGDSLLFIFSTPHYCDTIKNITGLEANGRFTYQDNHRWEAIVKPTQDITYTAEVSYRRPKEEAISTVERSYTVTVKERPHLFVDPPDTLKYCYDPTTNVPIDLTSANIINYNFVMLGSAKFLASNASTFTPKIVGANNYAVEANYEYLCSAMTTTLEQGEVRIVVNRKDEDGATFIKLPGKRFCEIEGITIESYNKEGSSLKWEHDGIPVTVFPEPYKPAAGAGTYTLTTLISNACYPDDPYSYPVHVEVVAVPKIEVMPDITVCRGDIVTLEALEFVGDELIWTTPPLSTPINNIVQIYNTTTFRGSAHYTDGTCGDVHDEVTITRMPDAFVKLMSDTSACQGDEIRLRVVEKDGDEIIWSTGNFPYIGKGESATITVGGHETYTATISNRCSSSSADLKVTELPLPYVALKADTVVCYGESLNLESRIFRREGILQWTPNESTAHTITDPTIYIATLSTQKCGSATDTMYVNVYPPLMLLPDDSNLPHYNVQDFYDVSFQTLHAVPNLTYSISGTPPPGLMLTNDRLHGQPTLGPTDYNTHQLQVSVVDGHHCKASKDYILAPEWKAANVLLPMGDAENAVFLPDYNLEVYSRNGLLMHEGMGWNGLWNNAFAPAGTYFYKVKVLIDGMPEERMNYVVVMYY